MSRKNAVAIRHVEFEDLGSFALPLRDAGYELVYVDAGVDDIGAVASSDPDLLVVLGGPIGAYEEHEYPFLNTELNILTERLSANRPTLGICLGAQLMARALGARVYPGPSKEIGWAAINLTLAGLAGPLHHLDGNRVIHWHGDTFDLPDGCELLGSTTLCPNQAFARGPNILALQFHPEITATSMERWLIGHASEIASGGLKPSFLRSETSKFAADLETSAVALFRDWLAGCAVDGR